LGLGRGVWSLQLFGFLVLSVLVLWPSSRLRFMVCPFWFGIIVVVGWETERWAFISDLFLVGLSVTWLVLICISCVMTLGILLRACIVFALHLVLGWWCCRWCVGCSWYYWFLSV